jgi:hypothetical protein
MANALSKLLNTTGPERTAWLERQLEPVKNALASAAYYVPPELRQTGGQVANALAMFSPGADVMDAAQSSGDMMDAARRGDFMGVAGAGAGIAAAGMGMFVPGTAKGYANAAEGMARGGGKDMTEVNRLLAEARARIAQRADDTARLSADEMPVRFSGSNGQRALVTRATYGDKGESGWRITYMDANGPSGHTDHASKSAAIEDALRQKYQPPPAPPASAAEEVAGMLRDGRGADITDEMIAKADPAELFDLYGAGKTGMDMPMDEASRIARAQGMGFDTGTPLYHGTPNAGFDQLNPSQSGKIGPGVYMTPNARRAGVFSGYEYGPTPRIEQRMNEDNPMRSGVYPLVGTDRPATMDARQAARAGKGEYDTNLDAYRAEFDRRGFDGVRVEDERTILDPSNIRSRFARFDPRLKHLANLSAAGAGVIGYNALAAERDRNEQGGM